LRTLAPLSPLFRCSSQNTAGGTPSPTVPSRIGAGMDTITGQEERSLHSAARRAIIRRERKNRAAPVGMTAGERRSAEPRSGDCAGMGRRPCPSRRPSVIGYSREMRLPLATPQPAAALAASMCSALVAASFMVFRWGRQSGDWRSRDPLNERSLFAKATGFFCRGRRGRVPRRGARYDCARR
jgi:hypothetical protein